MMPPQLVLVLLGGVFTCLVCWSTGKILLARLGIELFAEEMQLFRFVGGSACVSLLIFLFVAVGIAKTFSLVALGVVLIALARPVNVSKWRLVIAPLPPVRWLLLAALSAYAVFYFVNALAPESSPDGTAYHLALVKRYLTQRGFGQITTNMYASFPEGLEMLFLMAFSIGRHSAAALVEFAYLAILPLAVWAYSRRFGYGQAGLAAAVWIFVSPVFAIDGTTAYNDVAGTCVVFCTFYLLHVWEQEQKPALLVLIGLLAGFAYGIKYPFFLAIPYASGFVIWKHWRRPNEAVRAAGIVLCCAAVMVVPWMVKNWIVVGNPFSPFLNTFFPNPYITIGSEKDYLATVRLSPGVTGISRLFDSAVRGGYTAGLLGPIFLLTPLGLISLRWAEGRRLLLAAALFALPAFSNSGTRFLMPAAPFAALALALAVSRVRWAIPALVGASLILSWPPIVNRYCAPGAWRLNAWPIADALRLRPEAEILKTRLNGGYELARLIEAEVPRGGQVYSFGSPPESYINRQVISSYQSAYALRVRDVLWNPLVEDRQATWRMRFAFAPHAVRKLRVVQTATAAEEWSIAEFRIFHGNAELSRSKEWRIQAKPNPWDVGLAFDGSPVTRWTSGESIQSGMQVAVDFGHPQTIDAVVLDCSHDQWHVRLMLQEETATGVWKTIGTRPAMFDEQIRWDLRRAATDEVRAMGITHLLVQDGQYGADDYRKRSPSWGLSLLGKAGGYTLYSIL